MKRLPLKPGIVLAIPSLFFIARQLRNPNRDRADGERAECLLCGAQMSARANVIDAHGRAHVRRGELEEVSVDGVVWPTDGPECGTAWKGNVVGYRTPGAAGFYICKVLGSGFGDPTLSYYRGEMPYWDTFAPTPEAALQRFTPARLGTPYVVKAIPATEPPLPSTIDAPHIRKRIESAAKKAFPRQARELVYEHGHWWITVDGAIYDVVDAEGGRSIDGFDFEEVSRAEAED